MRRYSLNILKRSSAATLTAGLICSAVLSIMPLSVKKWIGQGVVGTLFAPLEWPLYQTRSMLSSWKENRMLKDELARLRLEMSFREATVRENQTLRQTLNLKDSSPFTMLAARVSAREPAWLAPELVIDKGSMDSVKPGMVAVSPMGLVGMVADVGSGAANLKTVFSPDSRVSAFDTRSRVLGIFRVEAGLECIMDRVALRSDVREGDTLVSSGYGGVYPYGLMLGVVKDVVSDKRKLVLDIVVEPSLDLNRLDQVLLITGGESPALPVLAPGPVPADSSSAKPKRKRRMTGPEIRIRAPDIRISLPDTVPLQMERNQ